MTSREFATRTATPDDAAAVEKLLQASYPTLMASAYDGELLAPALELMTRANASLLNSETYHVAESREGQLIGCGGWTLQRPGSGTVEVGLAHLRHFGTHPGWAGRGVGRAIYDLCESEAHAAGVTEFECYSSLNAEGFYMALGFESERREDIRLGPEIRLPGVIMRRRI